MLATVKPLRLCEMLQSVNVFKLIEHSRTAHSPHHKHHHVNLLSGTTDVAFNPTQKPQDVFQMSFEERINMIVKEDYEAPEDGCRGHVGGHNGTVLQMLQELDAVDFIEQ